MSQAQTPFLNMAVRTGFRLGARWPADATGLTCRSAWPVLFYKLMDSHAQAGIEYLESGDLAEVPFGRVFYGLCREERSGKLDVRDKPSNEGGKILKRLVMVGGDTFYVQGGTVQETLGEILLARGKLTSERYEELKKETGGDYGKMEQKILSGQVVPPAELSELTALQTALKIKAMFALIKGNYEFSADSPETLSKKHILVPLTPEKIVAEGVREQYPLPRIKREFPGIEKKTFTLSPDFKDRLLRLELPPGVQRWLHALPESFTWQPLLLKAPIKENEAMALLLAFYFCGLITLPEGEEDFQIGKAYAARKPKEAPRKDEKPAAAEERKKSAEASPPPKKEEVKLPIEEKLDRDLSDEEILAEIDRMLKVVNKKGRTYFEVLGVDEKVPSERIKKIYFKFVRKFHPDARPGLFQGEVRDKVEDLFTVVTEAYEVLGDPARRAEYEKRLSSKLSKEDMDKASRALEAEMEFQKAEILLKRSKWSEAAELLKRSVELEPEEPEYKMYLAWAEYKQQGVSAAARSRNTIKMILKERPKAADGYYYLGIIAKDEGDLSEAEQYLQKASSMKPHDIEIKRELQLLQRRLARQVTAPSKKGGGLFGRRK